MATIPAANASSELKARRSSLKISFRLQRHLQELVVEPLLRAFAQHTPRDTLDLAALDQLRGHLVREVVLEGLGLDGQQELIAAAEDVVDELLRSTRA